MDIVEQLQVEASFNAEGANSVEARAAGEIVRLRAALFDIAEQGRLIIDGDPAILRNHARRALGMPENG